MPSLRRRHSVDNLGLTSRCRTNNYLTGKLVYRKPFEYKQRKVRDHVNQK